MSSKEQFTYVSSINTLTTAYEKGYHYKSDKPITNMLIEETSNNEASSIIVRLFPE
jgi:hypothetical protein